MTRNIVFLLLSGSLGAGLHEPLAKLGTGLAGRRNKMCRKCLGTGLN
jgi:hypothetical protein